MRVNSIDNTNFQMALKLNPKTMPEKLNEKPMEYIIALNILGDRIKDVKFFDVVFEDNFIPQVKKAGSSEAKDYFQALKNEEQNLGKPYKVPSGFDGDFAGGINPKEPEIFRSVYGKEAEKKYSDFKELSILQQAGELSILLEKKHVADMINKAREESEAKFKAYKEKVRKEILNMPLDDDLVSKNELVIPEAKKPRKTSWWKRIFG